MVTEFIQQLINGIAVGCIYALIAIGFVLIYKATHVVNFAQGELMMLGAFFFYTFNGIWGFAFGISVFLAIVSTGALGGILDRFVLRRIPREQVLAVILATIALGFLARNFARMVPGWGNDIHIAYTPFSEAIAGPGNLLVSEQHLAIIVTTFLLVAGLSLFLRFTKLGLGIQASSQNQLAAYHAGIPVKSLFSVIWAVSAAIATVAGILLAPITFTHVDMGFLALHAFPAAVLGGFTSIPGTILGGLIVGVAEELAGFYLPEGFKNVAAYLILLAVLVLKPQGLLGPHRTRKV